MTYFVAIILIMASIAATAYFYERRNGTSRASRSNEPCIQDDDSCGDGRSEEFHGGESGDFDADGDGE